MIETDPNECHIIEEHENVYNLDLFVSQDLKECLKLIEELSLVSEKESKVEKLCERFDGLINKWQTNPKLIECHLSELLSPLIQIIVSNEVNGIKFNVSFKLIQRLVSCIGLKSVSRYFPTEVLWLTKLIDWCERQTPNDFNTWQTRSVLCLWLSMSVKTPFNLKKFDSINEIPISVRIYNLIEIYLKVSDKCRDSASLLAANFFSRPDIIDQQLLTKFMTESYIQMNLHLGHVIAIAVLFKLANRTDINPFAERILEMATKLDTSNHELLTKWKIKLIGRTALSLMSPRLAKWRYQRGRRILSQNISLQTSDPNKVIEFNENKFENKEDDCDYSDIPEQIELIIDCLLNGLHDSNTIVRWSSAKYLSRLANRLPKQLASDVVTHIIQLGEYKGSDSCWHGCCLALAELARRGLILVDQLPQVLAVLEKTLIFDEMKGTFSVGSNVRDAACFVCWSVSRAYESNEILGLVQKLAPILVCVTCFDREVNCRRAASAAIQEMAGRTQVFPHGLEVLVLTDFHSLSNRNNCYLDIALKLSQKPEFGKSLFQYLLWKCNHWDRDIRDVVALTIGKMSIFIDPYPYLDDLITKSVSRDLNSRHGAIQSIAHIIGNLGHNFRPEIIEKIESIGPVLKKNMFFKGMGGEFMKQAFCLLIERLSSAELPINPNVFDIWIEIISDSIISEDLKTRKNAIIAVPIFCQKYLINKPELNNIVLEKLLNHLKSNKESARIGSSESLKLMSKDLLSDEYFNKVFETFVAHIKSGDLLCNSRASETLALIEFSLKFFPIEDNKRLDIFECLCLALDDRSMDSRGDIGGNVRLAAIGATLLFVDYLNESELIQILKLMSTQCVSIWQKERKSAIMAFKQIIFNRDCNQINKQLIQTFFENNADEENEWKPFISLLKVDLFAQHLWKGLIRCVANPTETRVRNLLKHELNSSQTQVLDQFLELYENNITNELLSQSFINCSHFLLSSCRTSQEFRSKVLTLTWNCVRRSRDCRKIVSAIDVFCTGLQLSAFKQSLSYLTILLCHSFPRIRSTTANQTYVALLTADDINEDAIDLLSETDWTQPLDKLRPIRDRLCDALGIAKPTKVTANPKQ